MPTSGSSTTRCAGSGAFDGAPAVRRGRSAARARAGGGSAEPRSGPGERRLRDLGGFGLGDIFSSIFGRGRREEAAPETLETLVEMPVPRRRARRQGAGHAAGHRDLPHLPRHRWRAGRQDHDLPRVQGPGHDLVRPGRLRGQPSVSPVPRPGQDPLGPRVPPAVARARCAPSGGCMITVPPGTETGTKVRLKGQGQPGPGRRARRRPGRHLPGAAGPLLPPGRARPRLRGARSTWRRRCSAPRLRVRTLDGKKVVLKIPPGTQPGRKFRIKGQGIEKSGRRGDQLVAGPGRPAGVPLTGGAEELLKKFAEAAGWVLAAY